MLNAPLLGSHPDSASMFGRNNHCTSLSHVGGGEISPAGGPRILIRWELRGFEWPCRSRILFPDFRADPRPEPRGLVRGHHGDPPAYIVGELIPAQVHQFLISRKNPPRFVSRSGDSRDRDGFERAAKIVMELLRWRTVDRLHSSRAPDERTLAFGVRTVQALKLDEDGPRDAVPVPRVPTSQEPARHQPHRQGIQRRSYVSTALIESTIRRAEADLLLQSQPHDVPRCQKACGSDLKDPSCGMGCIWASDTACRRYDSRLDRSDRAWSHIGSSYLL